MNNDNNIYIGEGKNVDTGRYETVYKISYNKNNSTLVRSKAVNKLVVPLNNIAEFDSIPDDLMTWDVKKVGCRLIKKMDEVTKEDKLVLEIYNAADHRPQSAEFGLPGDKKNIIIINALTPQQKDNIYSIISQSLTTKSANKFDHKIINELMNKMSPIQTAKLIRDIVDKIGTHEIPIEEHHPQTNITQIAYYKGIDQYNSTLNYSDNNLLTPDSENNLPYGLKVPIQKILYAMTLIMPNQGTKYWLIRPNEQDLEFDGHLQTVITHQYTNPRTLSPAAYGTYEKLSNTANCNLSDETIKTLNEKAINDKNDKLIRELNSGGDIKELHDIYQIQVTGAYIDEGYYTE